MMLSMTITLSKQEAKNYLLNRTFLSQKASSLREVLLYLRCIQVDPIATYGRSHELALWNRVEGLKRGDINIELYQNHTLFEYWLQLYSIIPAEYYPYLKPVMAPQLVPWRLEYFREHREQITEVLAYLAKNKAIRAKDLAHIAPGRSILDWKGKASQKALLEYLWDTGEVMIADRKSNNKLYDLTQDVLAPEFVRHEVSWEESVKFHLESSFYYIGLLNRTFLNRHGRRMAKPVRTLFDQMLKSGEILQINVEGSKQKYFILKSQLAELEQHKAKALHRGLTILPPLDPLVIDRALIHDIFGFFYRWEAYTPPAKRLIGYYNMPLLLDGELAGQVQLDKSATGKLKIQKLVSTVPASELKPLLQEKLTELGSFLELQQAPLWNDEDDTNLKKSRQSSLQKSENRKKLW
jgi:uncharacterized protein YcaQ